MEYIPQYRTKKGAIKPRVIIHGGAGNITRENLPIDSWKQYEASLLRILRSTHTFLGHFSGNTASPTALDAAVHAVSLLETDPLFNAGIGAVFTRAGTIELEASVMVSRGMTKRGVGVSLLKHVRSPIKLAAELLKRGQDDNGGGAQGHVQLSGDKAESLAKEWGLEMCQERIFWTKKRWDEHKRGLETLRAEHGALYDPTDKIFWPDGDLGWDEKEYLPQGTVGCVVLDSYGTLAVATSTGGLTNKLPGRLGDTPTLGAGFWAEQWIANSARSRSVLDHIGHEVATHLRGIWQFTYMADCLPKFGSNIDTVTSDATYRAVAMSGTGNGDSFLKLSAVRTVAALARFSSSPAVSLQSAVSWMIGPNGELQRSAEDRWGKTGEGEGGIIGIELVGTKSTIVFDFNRAMFRTWVDDDGKEHCHVFRQDH